MAARLRLHLRPALDGARALLGGHRRRFNVVGRSKRHLGVDQPVAPAEVVRDAGIDDRQMHVVLPREHIDRGTAGQEVLDHLPGHLLRIGRNAGLRRTVIAGKNQQMRLPELGVEALLDQADLFGDLFELTERAERLGLLVDLLLQGSGQPLIGGGDVEFGMHPILPVKKRKRASRRHSWNATAKPCPQAP